MDSTAHIEQIKRYRARLQREMITSQEFLEKVLEEFGWRYLATEYLGELPIKQYGKGSQLAYVLFDPSALQYIYFKTLPGFESRKRYTLPALVEEFQGSPANALLTLEKIAFKHLRAKVRLLQGQFPELAAYFANRSVETEGLDPAHVRLVA